MSDKPRKPIPISNDKPLRWWQRSASISIALAAMAVVVFGVLAQQFATTDNATDVGNATAGQTQAEPRDAVQKILSAGKPSVIEFGANNCVSCREMKPILHALAQDPRIAVGDVDILKERDYISRYQIRLMPTQVFYDAKGNETGRHMGKISAQEILANLGMTQPNGAPGVVGQKAAL